MSGPYFEARNYQFFETLFHLIPPSRRTNGLFEFFILNPLASTWIFAAIFVRCWTKEDDQKQWRRTVLAEVLVALAIAILFTLALRPWVSWPAPNSNPPFQQMFSLRLQGSGNRNCFPSHSTLVYLIVALGLWRIDRRWSTGLVLAVLLFISLPRVYLGGHYPVDVIFSCILAPTVLALTRRWRMPPFVSGWLVADGASAVRNWLFFLWAFELGEGFRGSELVLRAIRKLWLVHNI